jgi:uncharacterized protein (DUF1501 family)
MTEVTPQATIPVSRRTFLVASATGFAGLTFAPRRADAAAAPPAPPRSATARSTILFFLCGGASHIDMWDLKPDAPEEYRGPFRPIPTSAPGVRLCEHLPLVARQAHHLAVVNSLRASVATNDHHAGYYYNLTGHEPDRTFVTEGNNRRPYPDDWPYMGAVVASRRPQHPHLPNAITLPHKPSQAPYTRPGQFAARLGVEFDPVYIEGSRQTPLQFRAPALSLHDSLNPARLRSRTQLLSALDLSRRSVEQVSAVQTHSRQHRRALELLASSRTAGAFDVTREPLRLRERYGQTVNGMSLLLARRLVEAGVPFITVFWMEDPSLTSRCRSAGGWDTHGNNFNCLRENLLPEFDRGFSALVDDLHARGLLEETLLLVTSEMGRKPRIGDPRSGGPGGAGRDHWTHCMSVVLAGGGIRGGRHYGRSDRFAEYPADNQVTPADIARTVYHAMGIADLEARDREGRPYSLLAVGAPLLDLF